MTDYLLDESLVERLTADMESEFNRSGPPEGFPEFHDIPAGRYTSQKFFEVEQKYLWTNSWICAGRESDLPENGSYFLFDELGPPLIVIRGKDGEIRCFSNTCMHRGAPIVREPTGTVRNLRCQFHAWTYETNSGKLLAVTDERDFVGLCKDKKGLPQISCDTWGGWIWINMNPNPKPLLDFLGKVAVEMEQLQPDNLELVATDHRVTNCNWKVAVEAFLEHYHFRFLHDRGGVCRLDARGVASGLLEDGNSRMIAPLSAAAVEQDGRESWKDFKIVPSGFGLEPIETVHPIVDTTSYSFMIFPNLITPFTPTGLLWMLFFPDGPSHTRFRIYHYSPPNNVDKTEAWEQRVAGIARVIDEDVENMDPMQRAMNSPLWDGARISYQERRIWYMHEVIDRTIGIDHIPEHLRVEQLLGDYIET